MELRELFAQGMAAHRAGRLAQAEQAYRQVLRAEPANFPSLHMLGFLKAQQGRYDEAITLLHKAVRQQPQDIPARSHYAHALMMAQRLEEALAAYDRVLAIEPRNFEALYNRGVVLSQQQHFAEALTALDAAAAIRARNRTMRIMTFLFAGCRERSHGEAVVHGRARLHAAGLAVRFCLQGGPTFVSTKDPNTFERFAALKKELSKM